MSNDDYLRCNCKECGNHIEFPRESAGTTVACPHCGQWTELVPEAVDPAAAPKKSNAGWFTIVGILLLVAAGAGFVFWRSRAKVSDQPAAPLPVIAAIPTNPPVTNPAPVKPAVPAKREKSLDDLKVSKVQLEKAKVGSLVYAVGTVTNASEFQRFGVKIELQLFGKNKKELGTATDYKDVIEPNKEWQFHALIPDPKTISAKVSLLKED